MINLKDKPFYLDDPAIAWVEQTRDAMTTEQKVGQLFCLIARHGTEEEVKDILTVLEPGGIMYRPMPTEQAVALTGILQRYLKIPALIAANLEKGGNGIAEEGTLLASPMGIAATDDVKSGERLGTLCAREGKAVGANWAFAPIIDIDYNFRNPITNTRTFGSDPARVAMMGCAYVEALQKEGVAASIKHFPGDGVDERDQHLLTSVNTLSAEDWDATFGMVWKKAIEAGAMTAMIGHIMQPAWTRKLNPTIRDEAILPASLSPEMMEGLLRKELGFNGLIVTDATTMAGMTIPMPRSQAVPQTIAAGADMFLFARNCQEDYDYMLQGLMDGRITQQRLNDAITRILATKAALGLHKMWPALTVDKALQVVGCGEHKAWAQENAKRAVTLVKEEPGILPLDPKRTPRVLYYPIESAQGFAYTAKQGVCHHFRQLLEEAGFTVTEFVPESGMEGKVSTERAFIEQYDVAIYFLNMVTKSNQTVVRVEWQQPMGANCPHYGASIPTLAISVENPYHLLDLPRVKTFINAYSSNDEVLHAIIRKLIGQETFEGTSPVDAFCGKWDTRL